MAFGSAAKKSVPTKREFKPTENIFFDIKRGVRLFRILGDEVRYKVIWVAHESDGTWTPKFGYNPKDRREAKPIIVAVFDPTTDSWIGNPYDNPLMNWVDLTVDEEDQTGMYAKEHFYVNVIDRTPVKIDGDTVYYPDPKNQFPENLKGIPAKVTNKVKIFQGSSGKVRDENDDIVGKHMYANLLRVIESGEVDPDTGNLLKPDQYDIRLVTTGTNTETDRKFTITANREVLDLNTFQIYNLQGWLRPYPVEFMEDVLAGSDWAEMIKRYNIKLYPDLVPYRGAQTATEPF